MNLSTKERGQFECFFFHTHQKVNMSFDIFENMAPMSNRMISPYTCVVACSGKHKPIRTYQTGVLSI